MARSADDLMDRADHDLRQRLLDVIASTEPAADGRLPTERRMAEILGVGRGPLRRLLAELEADSKIWRHVGRGTFLGTRPTGSDAALRIVSEHTSPAELLEARLVVEPGLAAFAALRSSAAEVAQIAQLSRKAAAAPSYSLYEKWDEALHSAIADASRNRTLIAVHAGLNELRRELIWRPIEEQRRRLDREVQRQRSQEHETVVAAIRNRDPGAARAAMRTHLKSFQSLYSSVE